MAPARTYTAAEVDTAIAALESPERFAHATDVVTHAAPGLQRVLEAALAEGGWFGSAHEAALLRITAIEDAGERLEAIRTLVDEQTRVGMLVGVAVGFELARELEQQADAAPSETDPQED
jgi:hypothetical protein